MGSSTQEDFDPTDIDGIERREVERRRRAEAASENSDRDIAWLLSGLRGRRIVRRQLREAGIAGGSISSSFHSNYGQMCFNEGLRVKGLQLFSKITKLLASGEIPLEDFKLLMSETDE